MTLTVQLYRVDKDGRQLGPAPGVQVKVNGTAYTADSNGKVSVKVKKGSTVTVEINQTLFNNGWGRYTFWRWSDNSTNNPRSFTVSQDTTVTAYVYDERLLKATWEPGDGGHVKVNGAQASNGWTSWYRYGASVALEAVPDSGAGYTFKRWMRGTNGGSLSDWSTSNPVTLTMDNGYQVHAVFQWGVVRMTLGTIFLPGEALPLPWILNARGWGWSGTWLLNVTELYPVKEHIAAALWDGSEVRVVDLVNGTVLSITLPQGWAQQCSSHLVERGGRRVLQLHYPCLPKLTWEGREWGLAFIAAWNPYKPSYDTSCWLANGTTLAVYNITYTYTFQNGTRVVFIQPVAVSTVKVSAEPAYSHGDLKQSLALKATLSWKYLPPQRPGIELTPPPPALVAALNLGPGRVYAGRLIDANSTSRTFLIPVSEDTWEMYKQGVRSASVEAWWLGLSESPQTPAAAQEAYSITFTYAMPYILSISEGSSFQAEIELVDVRTNQPHPAQLYLEFRRWEDYSVVASHGPFPATPVARVNLPLTNTKNLVLAIYAVPVYDPRTRLVVVPIAAVYPPRA